MTQYCTTNCPERERNFESSRAYELTSLFICAGFPGFYLFPIVQYTALLILMVAEQISHTLLALHSPTLEYAVS